MRVFDGLDDVVKRLVNDTARHTRRERGVEVGLRWVVEAPLATAVAVSPIALYKPAQSIGGPFSQIDRIVWLSEFRLLMSLTVRPDFSARLSNSV